MSVKPFPRRLSKANVPRKSLTRARCKGYKRLGMGRRYFWTVIVVEPVSGGLAESVAVTVMV